jgi:hypothetical protein
MLLDRYGHLHGVIAFVKDENIDLTTMATTMHSIIDCELLKICRVYEGTWFGHLMFKA